MTRISQPHSLYRHGIRKNMHRHASLGGWFKHLPRFVPERDLTPSILRCIEREESGALYSRLLLLTFVFSGFGLFVTGWRLHAIMAERDMFGPFLRGAKPFLQDAGFQILSPVSIKHLIILFHDFVPFVEMGLFVASATVWTFICWKIYKWHRLHSQRLASLRIRHNG